MFSFEHPPLHDPCAVAYIISPQLFKVLTQDAQGKMNISKLYVLRLSIVHTTLGESWCCWVSRSIQQCIYHATLLCKYQQ